MEDLTSAITATNICLTSFTPHDNCLRTPPLLFLQNNTFIKVLNRPCKRKNCEDTHQFMPSKRWKEGWETRCSKHTSYIESIKEGSFFSSFKLLINRIMYIIHHLAQDAQLPQLRN
jgi:hypothetical protein